MKSPARPFASLVLLILLAACVQTTRPTPSPRPTEAIAPTQPTESPSVPAATNAPGTLTRVVNMRARRAAHTATALLDGKVLVAGGFADEDHSLASAEIFEPETNTFTLTGDMAAGRTGHTATLLTDGRVLVAGGWGGRDLLASAELYDPATGQFTPTGPMRAARGGHAAVRLDDGKVLVVGGLSAGQTFLADAEVYDPATGIFTSASSMTTARAAHTITLLDDGRALITGGDEGRSANLTVHASAELYNPATGAFTATGDMILARHKHAAARLPDGTVLIAGGSDERDWQGRHITAEIYDPATETFAPTGSMNTARFKIADAIVLLKNGAVLVAGSGERAEIYSPVTGAFDLVEGQMDAARFFATAALLPDGKALVIGGYDQNIAASAGAWIFTP